MWFALITNFIKYFDCKTISLSTSNNQKFTTTDTPHTHTHTLTSNINVAVKATKNSVDKKAWKVVWRINK